MQTTRNMNLSPDAAVSSAPSSTASSLPQQQGSFMTVYQITAVAYVYDRIAKVFMRGPTTLMAIYLATTLSLFLLDQMTGGHAHVAIVMTVVLVFWGFQTIRLLTKNNSSNKSLDNAMRANQLRLPILSLLLSVMAARYVIQPLMRFTLGDHVDMSTSLSSVFFTWTYLKSLLRITCIVTLLGISVFARYIGRQSIMRLSCAPLAVNYVEHWIRSLPSVLNYSLLVGDAPGQLLATPNLAQQQQQQQQHRGRRFQRPTFLATVSQFIIGLVIGGAVAYLVDLDWFPHQYASSDADNRELFFAVLTASLLTVTSHYHLHNISQELSPFRYTTMTSPSFDLLDHFGRTFLQNLVKNVLYSIIISVMSMAGSVYFSSWQNPTMTVLLTGRADGNMTTRVGFMCALSSCTLLMQLYLSLVDENIKYELFRSSSGGDGTTVSHAVDSTITLFSHDSSTEYLNTLLASLLMDNHTLVTGVVEAATEPEQQHQAYAGVDDYGELYMRRIFLLAKAMGNELISPMPPRSVEAFLEEDVFRFAILESLGGGGRAQRNGVVSEWASTGTITARPGGQGQEPLIAILVRGLCVFLGGMSQAIGVCYSKPQKNVAAVETFELPAGVFACTNFALAALARCFIECFMERLTTPAKIAGPAPNHSWRSDHIKILIPIALNILYDLRSQIVRADAASGGEMGNTSNHNTGPLYRHISPLGSGDADATTSDLRQLLAACEAAATKILQTTTALRKNSSSSSSSPTAAMEFDYHVHNMPLLHRDAGRWLKDCNDASLSSGIKRD